jgi:RNA polymerase sigma factor FliA
LLREIAALTEELVPQAKAVAWRHFSRAPHALDRAELESIAFEGLMQAANKWESYCAGNGYNPLGDGLKYFGAYASKRMNGAILDHLRGVDWVTRSTRQRVKRIQAVRDSTPGLEREELLEQAQVTEEQARKAEAAVAARPVSLDDGERDIEDGRDLEGHTATVTCVLEAVAKARWQLPGATQVVLALRYYEERSFEEIAAVLGFEPDQVRYLHDSGVRDVHQAMAASVA